MWYKVSLIDITRYYVMQATTEAMNTPMPGTRSVREGSWHTQGQPKTTEVMVVENQSLRSQVDKR